MLEAAVFGAMPAETFRETVRPKWKLIPGNQRWILRHALGDELFLLRIVEAGGESKFSLSMEIKVGILTIATLESGRPTEKEVTIGTLYRFARRFSRDISIRIDGEEIYVNPTTPLEELIAVGAHITFVREG